MPEPWYRSDPNLFDLVRAEVIAAHPELAFVERDGSVLLQGHFQVAKEGAVLDSYQIEVDVPVGSPRELPNAREVAGRIPQTADRHNSSGTLCVVLPEAYWYHFPEGLSLVEFLDGPLRSNLAGQSMVELGESWPAGEWGHGSAGIVEFYMEAFQTQEHTKILNFMDLLTRDGVKGHWDCPCESGARLRNCHREIVGNLRARLPRELILRGRLAVQQIAEKAIGTMRGRSLKGN